jgi:hypothetical protein
MRPSVTENVQEGIRNVFKKKSDYAAPPPPKHRNPSVPGLNILDQNSRVWVKFYVL